MRKRETYGWAILLSVLTLALIISSIGTVVDISVKQAERENAIRNTMLGNPYTRGYAQRILDVRESEETVDDVMQAFFITHIGVPDDEYRWLYSNRAKMIELITDGECTWGFGDVIFTESSNYYLRTGRR